MNLTKGYTYLAITTEGGRKGWIVQQVSQRGWVATQFTEVTKNYGDHIKTIIQGNSIVVAEELTKLNILESRYYLDKATMRNAMFNILQYGSFYEQ